MLVLAEGRSGDPHFGKTARGVIRYRPDDVVALLDSASDATTVEGFTVVKTVAEALRSADDRARRRRNAGRALPARVARLLEDCLEAGLDLESGLHEFVSDDPELVALAPRTASSCATCASACRARRAVRREPDARREDDPDGRLRLCDREDDRLAGARSRGARAGLRSKFVPTGQTGIAIAGWGISVDAVVADFIAGAAERLVVEGAERGGEVLFVEGQGSLLHPAYSGVTLGLIHGSAPHALRALPQGGRRWWTATSATDPAAPDLVDLHERISLLARPAKVLAIALNTRDLDEDKRPAPGDRGRPKAEKQGCRTGMIRCAFGAGKLVDALEPQTELGRAANRGRLRPALARAGPRTQGVVREELLAALLALAALTGAGRAGADPLRYGVADDWPKFHPCGDVWWQSATDIRLSGLPHDRAMERDDADGDPVPGEHPGRDRLREADQRVCTGPARAGERGQREQRGEELLHEQHPVFEAPPRASAGRPTSVRGPA